MSTPIQSPNLPASRLPQSLFGSPLVNPQGLVNANSVWGKQITGLFNSIQTFQTGTHAQRLKTPAGNYVQGSIFAETDRFVAYVSVNGQWVYFTGFYPVTQATLPADLGQFDNGLLAYVTDYAHLLLWTGTAWTWAPGEQGSDFIVTFVTGPKPATGWHVCNGSAGIQRLNADGTIGMVTVPNTAGSWYRQ